MIDMTYMDVPMFEVAVLNEIVWFDVGSYETASVQVGAMPGWAGSPTITLVYANDKGNPATFDTSITITSAGTIKHSIDCGGMGFRWLGAKVTTASATTTDMAQLYFVAKAQGTGKITPQFFDKQRGM